MIKYVDLTTVVSFNLRLDIQTNEDEQLMNTTTQFKIDGMTCTSCAGRVENQSERNESKNRYKTDLKQI